MRFRLLDRLRRSRWRLGAGGARATDRPGPAPGSAAPDLAARPEPTAAPRSATASRSAGTPGSPGAHRRVGGGRPGSAGSGAGQAGSTGTRPATPPSPRSPAGPGPGNGRAGPETGGPGPDASPAALGAGRAGPAAGRAGHAAGHALPRRWGLTRAAARAAPRAGGTAEPATAAGPGRSARGAARAPWYEIAQANRTAPGRRHCGHIEGLIRREWAEGVAPPPEVVRAIDRLAELPHLIKVKLAASLDTIHVGTGGVPDLDDMGRLHGVPLPSGRATWDACAGAYGERKIIVGSRPSPTPDVMCHEIGHALDDLDGTREQWQSDCAEFQSLYRQCLPYLVSAFHRQPGELGRREFFADAFAAIASRQRPALVEMLGGDTRAALNVMLYFNARYGI
jgi:hypothetical protein